MNPWSLPLYPPLHCPFLPTLEIHPIKMLGLKETSRKLDYAQTKEAIIFKAAKVYLAFPNELPLSQ